MIRWKKGEGGGEGMRWWQRRINEGGDKVRVKVLGCQGGTALVTSPEYRGGG
jgi:hypothetical protein